MSKELILTQLISVLKSILKKPTIAIKGDDNLLDIGIDSISFMNLIVKTELLFNIEFDEEHLLSNRFVTVNDIVEYLATILNT